MTTYTIYPAVISAEPRCSGTYATARAGTGTLGRSTLEAYVQVGWDNGTSLFRQHTLEFNTSAAGVESAGEETSLSLNVGETGSGLAVAQYSWAGSSSDFRGSGVLPLSPEFGRKASFALGWNTITGTHSIPRQSSYKMIIWSTQQENATAPGANKYVGFDTSWAVGTTNDPYLTIVEPSAQGTLAATLGTVGVAAETRAYNAAAATITLDAVGIAAAAGATMPGTLAATLDAVAMAATATAVVDPTTPASRQLVFAANAQAARTITLARSA